MPGSISDRDDWDVWLYMGGRGTGKTKAGSGTTILWAQDNPGIIIHLVSATVADYRDVMVEGESGILASSPPGFRPKWTPSRRLLEWPNGSKAICFAAEEPRRLRGPQCHKAWCDEIVAWERPETWDMLRFGCRLKTDGGHPQIMISTTPAPIPILRELVDDPQCVLTRGTTFDNAANLSEAFLHAVRQKYEGTRLGRQELYAELIWDAPGALWSRDLLDSTRVPATFFERSAGSGWVQSGVEQMRVVVAVDPSVSTSEKADETGIVVACRGTDGKGYVLADYSGKYTPAEWARKAVWAYHHHRADRIVAEKNQGGVMVEDTLRHVDRNASIKLVSASRGKRTRAEPISALSEQKKILFVGMHEQLEDQLCTWDASDEKQANKSPDRLDAFVWAMTELMLQPTVRRNVTNLAPF